MLLDAELDTLRAAHATPLPRTDKARREHEARREEEGRMLDMAAEDSRSDLDAAAAGAAAGGCASGAGASGAGADAAQPAAPPFASRSVCDALRLLTCLLRQVWPRAAAHAPTIAKHATGAYLRAVGATHASVHPGGAADADAVLEASVALLRLLCDAGGEGACAATLRAARENVGACGQALSDAAARIEAAVLAPSAVAL